MVEQTVNCPHCRVKKSMTSRNSVDVSNTSGHFMFVCENCDMPVVFFVEADKPRPEYRRIGDLDHAYQSFEKCGWRILDSWPKQHYRKVEALHGVPDHIGALFEQCQEVALKGGYDLAMMGYVRVLNMAQAAFSSGKARKPHAWILSAIDDGHVTESMRIWANRVKGLRSDVENSTAKDAEELATFVHIVLEQLFGIASRVASFRAAARI